MDWTDCRHAASGARPMTAAATLSMPLIRLPTVLGVDLWLANLDECLDDPDALSETERARAERFVFARDRRRYIAAHATLRHLLSLRTGEPARRLEFDSNEFGKPRLRRDTCAFNLSHSSRVGVIALADGGSVGVDVEILRPMADSAQLAARLYSARERTEIAEAENCDLAFLHCWTRKEACLKAGGWGLSIEPQTFEVGAVPTARTIEIPMTSEAVPIAVESFFAGAHCVAAVARVLSSDGQA
jgi:4'-phosphopantetheinyl transferase